MICDTSPFPGIRRQRDLIVISVVVTGQSDICIFALMDDHTLVIALSKQLQLLAGCPLVPVGFNLSSREERIVKETCCGKFRPLCAPVYADDIAFSPWLGNKCCSGAAIQYLLHVCSPLLQRLVCGFLT